MRLLVTVTCLLLATVATAADKPASGESYQLRYRFKPGETLRWKVTHVASTETKVKGTTQSTESRTTSTKAWRVKDVDAAGNITFEHAIEDIDLWQKLPNRPEERYNSREGGEPPPVFSMAAESVGKTLVTVTITPGGRVKKRDPDDRKYDMGMGEIVFPFPDTPLTIGQSWNVPREATVQLPGEDPGRTKKIELRIRYTLEDVRTGVATIAVRTEVLTPVDDARIESQLAQQLTKGTIRFDMDEGRVISKQIDWDESIVGFNGPDTRMQYLARFNEELLPTAETAAKAAKTK